MIQKFIPTKMHGKCVVDNKHFFGAYPNHIAAMATSRRRQQNLVRKAHVGMIVKKLSQKLGSKSHRKRMLTTERLLPVGGLRRRCVKALFSPWVSTLVGKGRVLTKKLSEQVCNGLRKHFQLGACNDDGEEVEKLRHLMRLARKRKLGSSAGAREKPKPPAMSSMDVTDTLPLDDQEPLEEEDWCSPF